MRGGVLGVGDEGWDRWRLRTCRALSFRFSKKKVIAGRGWAWLLMGMGEAT